MTGMDTNKDRLGCCFAFFFIRGNSCDSRAFLFYGRDGADGATPSKYSRGCVFERRGAPESWGISAICPYHGVFDWEIPFFVAAFYSRGFASDSRLNYDAAFAAEI